MKFLFIFFFFSFPLVGFTQDESLLAHNNFFVEKFYPIEKIVLKDTLNFSKLTKKEKEFFIDMEKDSNLYKIESSDFNKKGIQDDLLNKRARITIKDFLHGKEIFHKQQGSCIGEKYKDTIFISTGLGFFAGIGVIVKIYNGQFTDFLFEYGDGEGYIKYELKDDSLLSHIEVPSLQRRLALSFIEDSLGKTVAIGRLSALYKEFYENENGIFKKHQYQVDVVFRCVIDDIDKEMKKQGIKSLDELQ